MVTWVDNASHVLWDTEWPEGAPKDDADWTEVQDHAAQLIAASTLLQLGGTGPRDAEWVGQDNWKTYAVEMGNAGKAALGAARAKNMPALLNANGNLTSSCEGCHKAFKPDLPTEGKMHQNPHSESHRRR